MDVLKFYNFCLIHLYCKAYIFWDIHRFRTFWNTLYIWMYIINAEKWISNTSSLWNRIARQHRSNLTIFQVRRTTLFVFRCAHHKRNTYVVVRFRKMLIRSMYIRDRREGASSIIGRSACNARAWAKQQRKKRARESAKKWEKLTACEKERKTQVCK